MNKQKLEYFHKLLIWQRRQATEDLRADRTIPREADDGVENIGEMWELDLNRSVALELTTRQRWVELKTAPMASAFVVASRCIRSDSRRCQLLSTVRNVRRPSRLLDRNADNLNARSYLTTGLSQSRRTRFKPLGRRESGLCQSIRLTRCPHMNLRARLSRSSV